MDEIIKTLSSPSWWFSSILVALIVNVISSLLYERITNWAKSVTSNQFRIACQVTYAMAIFLSSLWVEPASDYLAKMIPMTGFLVALFVIADIFLQTRFRFFVMLTTIVIFILNVTLEIYGGRANYTASWFATQFYLSVFLAAAVGMVTASAFKIRDTRKQLREYED